MTKQCRTCGQIKDFALFSKDSKSPDKRQYSCKLCNAEYRKANLDKISNRISNWRANNKQKIRQNLADYRSKNKEKLAAAKLEWQRVNIEYYLLRHRIWRQANSDKVKKWSAAYAAANLSILAWRQARRRSSTMQATPSWSNPIKIKSFYISCDALNMLTGIWHHVDHIVPLRGATVCGLHNEFNLQIITAKENRAKSNIIWPNKP